MADKKDIQYHNVAVKHHTQYHEYEPNFKQGERFRLAGTLHLGLDSSLDANKFEQAQKENNYQIDTWARIYRDTTVGSAVSVQFENLYGFAVYENIDQTALKAMIIEGQKREAARIALESAIAWQANQEGLKPKYVPSMLNQLHNEGKLGIGLDLIIDGLNYGKITDYIADNGTILLKTESSEFLYSNVDFRNEYNKLQNPCYYRDNALLSVQSKEPIDKDKVISFILDNHELLPLIPHKQDSGIIGSTMIKQMEENDIFMTNIGLRMADYIQQNNIVDIIHTSNKQVINDLVEMIKCEMLDQGYYSIPKERPTQQEFEYLQSLGYTEAAMAQKAEILKRWLSEKKLTDAERVVAMSIADEKLLHVIKDIDKDSIKEKVDIPLVDIYKKPPEYIDYDRCIKYMMYWEGKCKCTHIDLALGTIEENTTFKIPKFENDTVQQIGSDADHQIGSTDKNMYVTFDVSEEYQKMGGFDYELAMEQTMGKGQKQEEPSMTDPEVEEPEEDVQIQLPR